MKLYSGRGDSGYTYNPIINSVVSKSHVLVEVLGCLDEALSALNLAYTFAEEDEFRREVARVREILSSLGGHLYGRDNVGLSDLEYLESLCNKYFRGEFKLNKLFESRVAAALNLARALVRRFERALAKARDEGFVFDDIVYKVANRASDAIYALSIWIDSRTPPR